MQKIYLFLITILISNISFSKEKIVLGTFIIPRYVQSTEKGEFIELVKELSSLSGYEVEIKIFPPKRTLKAFKDKSVDGYFPALDALGHGKVSKTSDFYVKEDFIFERVKDSYTKMREIPKACLTRGYPYHKEVLESKKWKIMYAASDEDCIELLNLKRADLFIGEEITGLAAIETLKLEKKITYNKYTPISEQNVYFAFHDNKLGHKKSLKFDKALKSIIMSGKYDKLFHLKESK
jgi:polar amino acid transport system substrate-binding protein